jgi:hypothetical protein
MSDTDLFEGLHINHDWYREGKYANDVLTKKRSEVILGHELTSKEFSGLASVWMEWMDVFEHGSRKHQEAMRERRAMECKYLAYVLRNDLDRTYFLHPYPSPTTERLKKVWPLAKHLYSCDDPAGFLGPSDHELDYIFQAIQLYVMATGSDEYQDLIEQITTSSYGIGWYDGNIDLYGSKYKENAEFQAWLETDDYFQMFENRERRPDLIDYTDYDNLIAEKNKEWAKHP